MTIIVIDQKRREGLASARSLYKACLGNGSEGSEFHLRQLGFRQRVIYIMRKTEGLLWVVKHTLDSIETSFS